MTVFEVAKLFKLNQQTVRNGIDRGELRAVRVGTAPGGDPSPAP